MFCLVVFLLQEFADVAGSIPRDVYLGEETYPVRLIIRLLSFRSSMAFGWLNFNACQLRNLRTMVCLPDGLDAQENLEAQCGQVCSFSQHRVIFIIFHVRVAVANMAQMAQRFLCVLLFQTLNWTHRFGSHFEQEFCLFRLQNVWFVYMLEMSSGATRAENCKFKRPCWSMGFAQALPGKKT